MAQSDEVSLEVDPDDGVPLVLRHRDEHPVAHETRVVDQDVEATELVERGRHHRGTGVPVGDVADRGNRLTSTRGDLLDDRCGGILGVVVHHDSRAVGRERQRVGTSDPLTRARHDRHATRVRPMSVVAQHNPLMWIRPLFEL